MIVIENRSGFTHRVAHLSLLEKIAYYAHQFDCLKMAVIFYYGLKLLHGHSLRIVI